MIELKRLYILLLDQWNSNCSRKSQDLWTLDPLKKVNILNGIPHHLQFIRKTEQLELLLSSGNSNYCWKYL
jgi:hypothetical protein